MLLFLTGLVLLVVGYATYGRFVEKTLGPDDRETPAVKFRDGVDFLVLPHWKNMLIQLLNIAGIGPVIGVIAGIKFGAIAFLLIPIGNVIGGATHDFIAGMASLRNGGANLPYFYKITLGNVFYRTFSIFMILLLLLVVAVFINVPASLIDKTFVPDVPFFWWAVGIIFLYYIVATMFPVDKIIGAVYPIFGAVLLIGSGALFISLLWRGVGDPSLLLESEGFEAGKLKQPIVPCLFVTIACGILSGFHATQSPIIARTMKTERQARSSFYGMMVLEGVVAMIWAAAALAFYNKVPASMNESPNVALPGITKDFLGVVVGSFTVVAVVVLAITTGDTALRSARLSLAEALKIKQKSIGSRLLVCVPLVAAISGLLWWSNQNASSFDKLWKYFAWGNQVLAVGTLGAGTVWLYGLRKRGWIAAIPCAFMTFVVASFILWTSTKYPGCPAGLGLPLSVAYSIAAVVAVVYVVWCVRRGLIFAKNGAPEPLEFDSETELSRAKERAEFAADDSVDSEREAK